jgi:hypothetical protein
MMAAKTNYYKNTSSLNLNTVKALRSPSPFFFLNIYSRRLSVMCVIEGFDTTLAISKSTHKKSLSCEMEINVSELKVCIILSLFRKRKESSGTDNVDDLQVVKSSRNNDILVS